MIWWNENKHRPLHICGPGSVVGITTGHGLDGPGIESRCRGEIFRTCPDRPWGPPSLLYSGYRVIPGVKCGWSVTLTPHPLLVPWSRKVKAIPLLPLWAVRPVQSLSACTRLHFNFYLIRIYIFLLEPEFSAVTPAVARVATVSLMICRFELFFVFCEGFLRLRKSCHRYSNFGQNHNFAGNHGIRWSVSIF